MYADLTKVIICITLTLFVKISLLLENIEMSNVLSSIRRFANPASVDDYEPVNEAALRLESREIPYSSFVECNKIIEPQIRQNQREREKSLAAASTKVGGV